MYLVTKLYFAVAVYEVLECKASQDFKLCLAVNACRKHNMASGQICEQ